MAPNVLSFADRRSERSDWTNVELAELYRVENALVQAHVTVETDRGITDEGDPWFVFCRAEGDVIIHITRIGGYYHLFSPVLPKPLIGPSFSALTKAFLAGLRSQVKTDESVSIHPAALLSVLVAAIFCSIDFHSSSANAAEAPTHQAPSIYAQAGVQSDLAQQSLFHNLITSVKAFLEPSTRSDPQRLLLLTVENAAVAYAVGFFGFTEFDPNMQSGILDPTVGDNYSHQHEVDRATGLPTINLAHDISGSIPDLLTHASMLDNLTDQIQPNSDTTQYAAPTLQTNDPLAATGKAATSILDSIVLSKIDPLSIADRSWHSIPSSTLGAETSVSAQPWLSANPPSQSATNDIITIYLANGSKVIDASAFADAGKIVVTGNGDLQINDFTPINNQSIEITPNSTPTIKLSFGPTALAAFTLQMNGHDSVSLADVSGNTPPVHLTVDSEGTSANELTIADSAAPSPPKLNISIVGAQDLTLNESARTFNNSTLETAHLKGALTLSLNLDSVFQSVDLSAVNATKFVVGDSGNVALLHAASGSHIQLTSDLNMVDLTIAGATTANPGSLSVDLQPSASHGAVPIDVNLLDVFCASDLAINSSHAGPAGINTIETLQDSSLATLVITGESALTIHSISGPSAGDGQDVVIDAHAFTGALNLDVSAIADTAASGRSITIIGGSADTVLTNSIISEHTTFVAGSGTNVINIGSGSVNDSIVNLKAGDTVNIGDGAHNDVLINETNSGTGQATIDSQSNITAAAQAASLLARSSAADQALLFSYHGNTYVFNDVAGNHIFDAGADAVVKLVGVVHTAELAGVFHSA